MRYKRGYGDFPWLFNSRCPHSDTKFGGGVHGQYPTISRDEALAVWAPWIASQFDENAIMFWWGVNSQLDWCIDLLKACGFQYSTVGMIWIKTNQDGSIRINPGHHTAGNSEPLLIGMRGSIAGSVGRKGPEEKMMPEVWETEWPDWVENHHGGLTIHHPLIRDEHGKIIHSRKPAIFRELIDRLYPAWIYGKGLELFARERVSDDWHVFGNEVDSDVEGPKYNPVRKGWDSAPGAQMKLDLGGVA